MGDLQVWTNGDDWVVAESEADATSIVVDLTGCDPTDVGPWKALSHWASSSGVIIRICALRDGPFWKYSVAKP